MSVKLGINPLTWTNDDMPSLGANTPIEQCLDEGKEAGFEGFELGNKFPRNVESLSNLLQPRGLKLVSGWFSSNLLNTSVADEKKRIENHLALLADMGADVMVFCDVTDCVHGKIKVPVTQRRPFPKDRWNEYADKLNELAEYTLSRGVKVAYHPHMGTVIQSQREVDQLMSSTSDAVGLLLDVGHLTYAGADVMEVTQRWSSRICHVHCKDVRFDVLKDAINRNLSFLNAVLNGVFTVPGDGNCEFSEVFDVLKQTGYEGWLVVEAEQDPSIAHPLTYARMGYKNLYRMANEARLIS